MARNRGIPIAHAVVARGIARLETCKVNILDAVIAREELTVATLLALAQAKIPGSLTASCWSLSSAN